MVLKITYINYKVLVRCDILCCDQVDHVENVRDQTPVLSGSLHRLLKMFLRYLWKESMINGSNTKGISIFKSPYCHMVVL